LKKRRVRTNNETLWFISYSDLITAILAVLVLMMSFSKIDIEKVDHANRLMKDDKLITLAMLKNEYSKMIEEKKLQEIVNVSLKGDGLTINMSSSVQFDTDSSLLNIQGMKRLEPILKKIINDSERRHISIIGHTDSTGTAKRNWELSSQRAYAVLIYLLKNKINDKHVQIIAHASNLPMIEPKNLQRQERKLAQAINRRVGIIIGKSIAHNK